MKHAVINSNIDILHKVDAIEKEIINLKISILKKLNPTEKKIISLKGVLKNVEILDEDIISAKKSLYSKIGI